MSGRRKALISPRILLRGFVLVLSFIAFGYFLKATSLGTALDKAWIDSAIRGQGAVGEFLFIAAAAVFTGLGLPRHLIGFLGGYAFGALSGTALALAAAAIGCAGAFFYARLLGRDFVARRFPGRVRKIDDFLSRNPFSMTLLIRLLPVGSNLAVNLTAGVSRVNFAAFIGGSIVGYIPQTFVFALMGSGINIDPVLRISVSVFLFALSGAIGIVFYRRYRHGKTPGGEIESRIGGKPEETAIPNSEE